MEADNKKGDLDKKTTDLLQDIMSDQLYMNRVMEESKNEYFKEIEKIIPEEPKDGEDSYTLSFGYKNSKEEFTRKFSPNDSVNDLKNYAKVAFRKNSDFNMFTKEEGKILFDTNAKIKDSGINKGDKIMIHDEEDL